MKCKDGYIYFAPQNKCIPQANSIYSPKEQRNIGAVAIGSIALGGILGWLMRDKEDRRHPHDAHERNLILEYNMADFIPQIDLIDFHYLESDEIQEINDGITIGVVKRLKEVEDQGGFDSLYFDLQETQNFIEKEAEQEDAYNVIVPIVNHINDLQQIMDHFDSVEDMIEYMDGSWE